MPPARERGGYQGYYSNNYRGGRFNSQRGRGRGRFQQPFGQQSFSGGRGTNEPTTD